MNLTKVEQIANALLYEGYLLYPYRATAVKNRLRWNFGVVAPQMHSLAKGSSETWSMKTECLVLAEPEATLEIKARFLHLMTREVGTLSDKATTTGSDPETGVDPRFQVVDSLEVGGELFQTWQEAVEREVITPSLSVDKLLGQPLELIFGFPSRIESEPLHCPDGLLAGLIVRRQRSIRGALQVSTEQVSDQLFKVVVTIQNWTSSERAEDQSQEERLMGSLVSAHTILSIESGEFVSLLDPADQYRDAAQSCCNVGTYPVLAGEEGDRHTMLSSPIILYDYPKIAEESGGDLFDSTEIDEILSLRILTLTDAEKREMRNLDERSRRILERTETLPPEQMMKLHGVMRSLGRATTRGQ